MSFTWKPPVREGSSCSAWPRRAGGDLTCGALGERRGAAQPETWAEEQARSPPHCRPEGTWRGSVITEAFSPPAAPGGFRRAWRWGLSWPPRRAVGQGETGRTQAGQPCVAQPSTLGMAAVGKVGSTCGGHAAHPQTGPSTVSKGTNEQAGPSCDKNPNPTAPLPQCHHGQTPQCHLGGPRWSLPGAQPKDFIYQGLL